MSSSNGTVRVNQELDALKARAERALRAEWKYIPPHLDSTPQKSMSQEELLFIEASPGANQKPISMKRDFSKYLDKVKPARSATLFVSLLRCWLVGYAFKPSVLLFICSLAHRRLRSRCS